MLRLIGFQDSYLSPTISGYIPSSNGIKDCDGRSSKAYAMGQDEPNWVLDLGLQAGKDIIDKIKNQKPTFPLIKINRSKPLPIRIQ